MYNSRTAKLLLLTGAQPKITSKKFYSETRETHPMLIENDFIKVQKCNEMKDCQCKPVVFNETSSLLRDKNIEIFCHKLDELDYSIFTNKVRDSFENNISEPRNKIQKNWFCNRPFSPINTSTELVNDVNTNSCYSASTSKISSNLEDAEQYSHDEIISSIDTIYYDSDKDPEFVPDSDENAKSATFGINFIETTSKVRNKFLRDNYASSDSEENAMSATVGINFVETTSKVQNKLLRDNYASSDSENEFPDLATTVSNIINNLSLSDEDPVPNKNNTVTSEIPGVSTGKRIREKDFCYFCDTYVLNFARHVFRNHKLETEVQRILAYPVRSKERKDLLTLLRNRGNFLINSDDCRKPMKKSEVTTKFLPCEYCLGYYARKQLWRHKKKCIANKDNKSLTQVQAQNYLVRNMIIDKGLREKVFPHMRADDVSLVVKKDPLICAFGARYLQIHKEKHFINVTSRKMREIAKLLIEARKLNPAITNLFTALQPQHFDTLVMATKIVAKFDTVSETFESPTFAMNIATSLKQCCDIALIYALKKKDIYATMDTSEIQNDLRTLIQLLTSHWKFEISSQAANDLNIKKWNKVTIVPLASDLKMLKNYLLLKADESIEKLNTDNNDINAFNTLLETIYCRVILLNRKRPGELQRLLLKHYELCTTNDQQNYEEFGDVISLPEKILVQKFKRLIIRGKRGRGVPVLFSEDVQKHITILLSYRSNFIDKVNPYLFSKAGCNNSPICGYKILQKYAKSCGAKNPDAITSTKLRKHLATLTQIFNMTDNDIEQLATFMGHTKDVHKNSYRLPDDVYQTAKISKLLLLMEQGTAAEYKGRTLDEIEVNLDENLLDEKDSDNEIDIETNDLEMNMTITNIPETNTNEDTGDIETKKCKTTKPKRELVPWTDKQKTVVNEYFKAHIKNKQPPKRHECEELISQNEDILRNKSWLKIKVYVQNKYTKKLK